MASIMSPGGESFPKEAMAEGRDLDSPRGVASSLDEDEHPQCGLVGYRRHWQAGWCRPGVDVLRRNGRKTGEAWACRGALAETGRFPTDWEFGFTVRAWGPLGASSP